MNQQLNCKICKRLLENPVLISCGETICQKCVACLIDSNEPSKLNCPLCLETHEIPSNGFILNKFVVNLLKSNNLSMLELTQPAISIQNLKYHLDILKLECDKLENGIKNSSDELFDYCSKMRQEVQTNSELKIQCIQRLSEDLIKQIDAFEKECFTNLSKEADFSLIKDFINTINQFSIKWSPYIKPTNLFEIKFNQNDIEDALTTCKSFELKLRMNVPFFRSLILNCDRLLEFDVNLDEINSDLIGLFTKKRRVLPKFSELKVTDLKPLIADRNKKSKCFKMVLLDNGNYVLIYSDVDETVVLIMFDSNFTILKKSKITIKISSVLLYSYKNLVITHLFGYLNDRLNIYDENLHLKSEGSLATYNSLIAFNDKNIFGYDASTNSSLCVYDWDLSHQATITSFCLNEPYFHLPLASQFVYYDAKFYFLHYNSIIIVKQNDGSLIKTINGISANTKFAIDRCDGFLIALNENHNKLLFFTSNGELVNESGLSEFSNRLEFCVSKRAGLVFYDTHDALIYS